MSLLTYEILHTIIMYDFYLSLCHIFFNQTFLINGSQSVFISILDLPNRSLKPNISATSLRHLILQCSSLSIILTSYHKGRQFPFSFHIWSAIPDFSTSLDILPFNVPQALLLGGGILYHNCMGWSTHNSWSCCILLEAWQRYFQRAMLLMNIVLIYVLHIF